MDAQDQLGSLNTKAHSQPYDIIRVFTTHSFQVAPEPQKSSSQDTSSSFMTVANSLIAIRQVLKMKEAQKTAGPKLFRKEVIRYFKLHLDLCSSIGSIAFCWNKETNEFESVTSKVRRFQFHVHISIAIIHNIFLIWSLMSRDMARFGIAYKMLSIYFTAGYVLCNGLRVFVWLYEKEIVKLVNANFSLEERIRVFKNKRQEDPEGVLTRLLNNAAKSQRALLVLGLVTGLSVPLLVFLILLANPCQPPFIGSIIFEYANHHCIVSSWPLHFAISIANFWMHLDMVLPMVFTMFALFFLSVSCLDDYVECMKRKLQSKCREHLGDTLFMYRRIQIMEKQLNACFRQQYFPLLLSGMTTLLIFCLYSCIRLHDKIPMPGFSYFPIVALNGIVSVLVMNTKAANVLEHSLDLVVKFRNDPTYKRKHWAKKMAWSLTPLKINFMMNFVDKSTPLIFINFSLNQVVSLLLVGSERKKDVQIEDVLS
ncbi:unnamed protein product [Orchesella dallaii]|uniref:Odorant receptor n=1 Tax=Orchesella dallaii TaxID=48710 RepID=A0ABP1QTK7_9HEXA